MSGPPLSELEANILKSLLSGLSPMTSVAVAKALPVGGRPRPKILKAQLDEMTAAGLAVRIPGKTPKFVFAPIEAWVRTAWLALLSMGPQPEAKLKKVLPQGFEAVLDNVLKSLLSEGKVFVHPPLTRARKSLYALKPADPASYFAKDLDKLLAGIVKLGFTARAVRDAALRHLGAGAYPEVTTTESLPGALPASRDEILRTMRWLEPRVDFGAAVAIARLRQSMGQALDKQAFDTYVLDLARQGVLELQSHAWPARLTRSEREELIDNGRGGWFDSAALRKSTQS